MLCWKQISANGLATTHNSLASIRYKSKAVPDIGQELPGDENEAQDPFSGIADIVVERDNKCQDDHRKKNCNGDASFRVCQRFELLHWTAQKASSTDRDNSAQGVERSESCVIHKEEINGAAN